MAALTSLPRRVALGDGGIFRMESEDGNAFQKHVKILGDTNAAVSENDVDNI